MHKSTVHRLILAAILLATAAAVPASAQVGFSAEIDCRDTWAPGQQVPFTVRFEEQAFISHDIQTTVRITVPGRGQHELASGTLILGPNQDVDINRTVNLPMSAPAGSYQMSVTADDGSEISFDTCSFNVR